MAAEQGRDMLIIALMTLLAIIATVVALIIASPLYRTLSMTFGGWAEAVPAPVKRPRY
jgi:hypothetical protein